MSKNERRTEQFISHDLPEMATAPKHEVGAAFLKYMDAVKDVVGDTSNPIESNFSWPTLHEIVDDQAVLPANHRAAISRGASVTAFRLLDKVGPGSTTIMVHSYEGTTITASPNGQVLAAVSLYNPKVPISYGNGDPYALAKLGEAFAIDKLVQQGAEAGKGYRELTAMLRLAGKLSIDGLPHIGMASLYEGSKLQVVSASTGRTTTPSFNRYTQTLPQFVHRPQPEAASDYLAGLVDTLSSTVACRIAVHGPSLAHEYVELPDPNHKDYIGVDWN